MHNNKGPTYNPPPVLTYADEPDAFKCSAGCDWKGTAAQAVDAATELEALAAESRENWRLLANWLDKRPGAFKPKPKPEAAAQQASPEPKPGRPTPTEIGKHVVFNATAGWCRYEITDDSGAVIQHGTCGSLWEAHRVVGEYFKSCE